LSSMSFSYEKQLSVTTNDEISHEMALEDVDIDMHSAAIWRKAAMILL